MLPPLRFGVKPKTKTPPGKPSQDPDPRLPKIITPISQRKRRPPGLPRRIKMDFLTGIKNGNMALVSDIFNRFPGPATELREPRTGHSPLHIAVLHQLPEMTRLIIDAIKHLGYITPQINADQRGKSTPLHYAADSTDTRITRALLKAGADASARNKQLVTPLHLAAGKGNAGAVRELLQAGADPLALTKDGESPLHKAADMNAPGSHRVVELLLDAGANPNVSSVFEETPLSLVIANGTPQTLALMLDRGGNADERDIESNTLLHLASLNNREDMAAEILKRPCNVHARNNYLQSPLHLAAARGQVDLVRRLLDRAAAVDAIDSFQQTPLHYLALFKNKDKDKDSVVTPTTIQELAKALVSCGAENITSILEAGDDQGNTPLHHAAKNHNLPLLQWLLSKGAKVDSVNDSGETPLMIAIPAAIRSSAPLETLLENGADINIRTKTDDTVLHLAGHHGAKAAMAFFLKKLPAQATDIRNKHGETPLHLAALGASLACAKLLVETGKADIHARDHDGDTPLHVAVLEKDKRNIVQYLLEQGADMDAVNNRNGRSPLHIAASVNHVKAAEGLLKKGANRKLRDKNGMAAYHIARKSGHKEFLELLQKTMP